MRRDEKVIFYFTYYYYRYRYYFNFLILNVLFVIIFIVNFFLIDCNYFSGNFEILVWIVDFLY